MADVTDVPSEHRFVIEVDGARAGFVDYVVRDDTVVARHTEIDPAYAGQGLGSVLVKAVLDDIRDAGKKIRPVCPFVASYLSKHSEYDDLVAPAADS
ncbi:MAG: GNAT family N-acetyltransferase [Nocardioidaceae bacterium]